MPLSFDTNKYVTTSSLKQPDAGHVPLYILTLYIFWQNRYISSTLFWIAAMSHGHLSSFSRTLLANISLQLIAPRWSFLLWSKGCESVWTHPLSKATYFSLQRQQILHCFKNEFTFYVLKYIQGLDFMKTFLIIALTKHISDRRYSYCFYGFASDMMIEQFFSTPPSRW